MRSLAFKCIRVIYRCWKERTPYDEETYLASLRRRGSPLLAYLPAPNPAARVPAYISMTSLPGARSP